ncbi:hypothetical protein WMY93_033073 [Mugilogobius chulae]|uniref:Uncharacterized protein n=1 Tax=Mugilogobius chulae TaxID=88201 RepID=A0AAW0MUI1_9GOBI
MRERREKRGIRRESRRKNTREERPKDFCRRCACPWRTYEWVRTNKDMRREERRQEERRGGEEEKKRGSGERAGETEGLLQTVCVSMEDIQVGKDTRRQGEETRRQG